MAETQQNRRDKHEKIESRINLESTPDPESYDIDSASTLEFIEQQSRYEKSAQDEEQINARPSHLCPQMEIVIVDPND